MCLKNRNEVCVAASGQHKVGDVHGSDDEGEEVWIFILRVTRSLDGFVCVCVCVCKIFLFIWLCRVLVAACGIFIAACGILVAACRI